MACYFNKLYLCFLVFWLFEGLLIREVMNLFIKCNGISAIAQDEEKLAQADAHCPGSASVPACCMLHNRLSFTQVSSYILHGNLLTNNGSSHIQSTSWAPAWANHRSSKKWSFLKLRTNAYKLQIHTISYVYSVSLHATTSQKTIMTRLVLKYGLVITLPFDCKAWVRSQGTIFCWLGWRC